MLQTRLLLRCHGVGCMRYNLPRYVLQFPRIYTLWGTLYVRILPSCSENDQDLRVKITRVSIDV
jgi:hypothetical protein